MDDGCSAGICAPSLSLCLSVSVVCEISGAAVIRQMRQAWNSCWSCASDSEHLFLILHLFSKQDLIENVVAVAENTADELARSDGREVQLEEDPDLQLPFLLPEDGYSCDVVRNIPNGLQEFLDPLCQRGKLVSMPESELLPRLKRAFYSPSTS